MKKYLALVLVAVLALSVAACSKTPVATNTDADTTVATDDTTAADDVFAYPAYDAMDVMTYEEFAAASVDDLVCVETYVQAKQSWWDNQATFYTQSEDGAYFLYNMPCTEDDFAALTAGTKIKVTGYKSEWAGEVEITDAAFEVLEGNYVAEAADISDLLGTDNLISAQNKFVAFKGMTIEAYDEDGNAFAYKNADEKTDDLYFKASVNGTTYDFCVEYYLCGSDTEVYKAVEALEVGQVVDMEGFLYWYEGANAHITALSVVG